MDARGSAEAVTAELRQVFGSQLRSVVLYGSVARGEHVPARSDTNLLVLLTEIQPSKLGAAAPRVRAALETLRAPPLILGWDEWSRASDAFAVEVADMKDAHVMLLGEDPLVELTVEPRALRLQAERELRGRLVRLHTAMLLLAEEPDELGALLVAALPNVATYLRTALRLAGKPVPGDLRAVLTAGASLVGASADSLLRALHARTTGNTLSAAIDGPLLAGYDAAVRRTADYIDRFDS
jgi:predicted nucleotidyltransferase